MQVPDFLLNIDRVFEQTLQLSWAEVLAAGVFAFGLVAYYIIVYHFYHFICRRDTFKENVMHYDPGFAGVFEMIAHAGIKIIKYGVLFPIVSFFWFVGFAILLFVGTTTSSVHEIGLLAIGIISASRILAYYNERVSEEFTQTLPIIVLCVLLVQTNALNPERILVRLNELPMLGTVLFQYILFLSALEMGMRLFYVIKKKIIGHPHRMFGLNREDAIPPSPAGSRMPARPKIDPDSFLPKDS